MKTFISMKHWTGECGVPPYHTKQPRISLLTSHKTWTQRGSSTQHPVEKSAQVHRVVAR